MTEAAASIWAALAAPIQPARIKWRQDGKVTKQERNGQTVYSARFVPYIDAEVCRIRLDDVCPGWTMELANPATFEAVDRDGASTKQMFTYQCRLTVADPQSVSLTGIARDGVGQGKDWKTAATDAFKRACAEFRIGHDVTSLPHIFVKMDGDGKWAKPVEDPKAVAAAKFGWNNSAPRQAPAKKKEGEDRPRPTPSAVRTPTESQASAQPAPSTTTDPLGGPRLPTNATSDWAGKLLSEIPKPELERLVGLLRPHVDRGKYLKLVAQIDAELEERSYRHQQATEQAKHTGNYA